MTIWTTYKSVVTLKVPSKLKPHNISGQSLSDTCLLDRRWTAQRWHELSMGVYMEHKNLRTNVKGESQVDKIIRPRVPM